MVSQKAKAIILDQKTVVIGADDDIDALELLSREAAVFSKDFLSTTILRGELDIDSDEFRMKKMDSSNRARTSSLPLTPTKAGKRGRPRKTL